MSKPEPDRELRAAPTSQDDEVRYAVAPITQVEVRDPSGTDDNTWTMSGYAAVFDQATTIYDGKFIRLTESIAPEAFDRLLREQPLGEPNGVVHFNFGHDMNTAVAASDVPNGQAGSLQLRADKHGLFFLAKVSRDDPDGVRLAAKMRSGVVKQASFAFTVAQSEISITENDDGPDEEHRRITDMKWLYDVCACGQGAYSTTVSQLRSLAAAIGQPAQAGGQHRQPDPGGEQDVSPAEGGDPEITPELEAAHAKADEALERWRRHGFKPRKTD